MQGELTTSPPGLLPLSFLGRQRRTLEPTMLQRSMEYLVSDHTCHTTLAEIADLFLYEQRFETSVSTLGGELHNPPLEQRTFLDVDRSAAASHPLPVMYRQPSRNQSCPDSANSGPSLRRSLLEVLLELEAPSLSGIKRVSFRLLDKTDSLHSGVPPPKQYAIV